MAAVPLASATDLAGTDLGGGSVELRWDHPDDVATRGIRFDVYANADPLDPFRSRRLTGHAGTTATLAGFERGGDVHFTVVARLGEASALPSRILRLAVRPLAVPVT